MQTITEEVTYVHRYEYTTRNADGTWTEPVIRYANETSFEESARARHEECKDYECLWTHKFEGTWGYRWRNCVLVKRVVQVVVTEHEI